MGQTAENIDYPKELLDTEDDPFIIVGNGPAGIRIASELAERLPDTPVVIFGDEKHKPYNRIRLSSWLAGDIERDGLDQPLRRPFGAKITEHIGCRITAIDRKNKTVTDDSGRQTHYRKLILATGSSPSIPGIPGIDLGGAYTFRDLDDTSKLLERRLCSRHTVVLGGGLLGLEAARGMQSASNRVVVVEHADRLLGQQLDEQASDLLKADVEKLGIEVVIADGVARVLGEEHVTGVRLMSGRSMPCDTLVVATGIKPNIQLAMDSRLSFGRGIKVDDQMRTSDPDIYAVGECAEHRGHVYGLVAPGLEQSSVAAADIAKIESAYAGSVVASRLKVVGTQVFSMGPMGAGEDTRYGNSYVFRNDKEGIYRKILIRKHRLAGAIGIGQWDETVRLQTGIGRSQLIWPWQRIRFQRSGRLWPVEDSQGPASWPASAIICQCTGVTRGAIGEAISTGSCSAEAISKSTGASTVCGSCKPLVLDLLGSGAAPEPVAMQRTLFITAIIALLTSLGFLFLPTLSYSNSVQQDWHWDVLWRDGFIKQVSGFSILGLAAISLLLSIRKRTDTIDRLGSFDYWRLAHIMLGLLMLAGLIAHTGFRLGNGLNFFLIASFSLLMLVGAVSTGVIALEHRIGGMLAQRLRRQSVFMHIILFWPVPALLGWHVFKTYWF